MFERHSVGTPRMESAASSIALRWWPVRTPALLLTLVLAPATLLAQAPAPVAQAPRAVPTENDRFEEFLDASVRSPLFYVQAIGSGVLDELGGFPVEWRGLGGFTKRNTARVGQGFAAEAIGHGAAAALGHRVSYDACTCSGFRRVTHAISRAFVSIKSDGHSLAPNWSLWGSKYASAGLANAWYPKTYTKGDVLVQGTGALGTAAGLNIVKEFAPELLRLVHLR
jgi:hypothetical protein